MCDFGGFNISQYATGENLKMAGSIFGDLGEYDSQRDVQKQYRQQIGQITENTQLNMKRKAYSQARGLSEKRANYGKAGVKMTGSALDYINEQVKQDELDLLNMKYEASIGIGDAAKGMRSAGNKANTAISSGLQKAGELYTVNKGFGLGSL